MYSEVALSYARRVVFAAMFFSGLCLQAANVKFAWDASASPNISGYTLKYGTSSGSYPNTRNLGNVLTGTISNLQAGVRYYVVVTARSGSGAESDPSGEVSYTPSSSTGPNRPPVINSIANVSLNEDTPQVVNLSGIGAGTNEVQDLTVTATSSNPSLIPNPVVTYTSPNSTGSLNLVPAANANGTATITVTVNDGQSQSNTVTRTFTATVNAVNDPPSLNTLVDLNLGITAPLQTVALAGIGPGAANESQTLTVTASHNNSSLLGVINVNYLSPTATGALLFTPLSGKSGSAVITVRVQDSGTGANVTTRTFNLNVGTTTKHTLFAEAESAVVVSPMTRRSDSRALSGQYVSSLTSEKGTASFTLNIPATGTYRVWCRTLSPYTSADSFYVKMDSGAEDIYDTTPSPSSNWQWTRLNGRANGNPRVFNLSAGNHTIVFRGRENTTALDAIYVTDDTAFVPGTAPAAAPPVAINLAPTLNPIADLSLQANAGLQTVNLAGIAAGAPDEIQPLTITATSSNPSLIPNPNVVYTSPDSTGRLNFAPAANATGTATINVTVSDGQVEDSTFTRTFSVTVVSSVDLTGPVVSNQTIESSDAAGFTLSWRTDEPASGRIEYGLTSSLGASTALEASASLVHRASVTNLLSGTRYYYRVRSSDAAGNGSVTTTTSFITAPLNIFVWAAEAGTLTAPMARGTSETAFGESYVSSATANSGTVAFPIQVAVPSTYRLWCRLRSGASGNGSFLASVDGGAEDIFDVSETSWNNGWRWVALNGRGGSAPLTVDPRTFSLTAGLHQFLFRVAEPAVWLDELILSNDPRWVPGIHGTAPILSAGPVTPQGVALTWTDATTDEEGFQIEVSTDGTTFAALDTVWSGTTSYQHTGVAPGSTYYYRVYAFTDSDRTDYSNVASSQASSAPSAPSALNAQDSSPGNLVELTWQDNSSNETGFSIERSEDGNNFVMIQSVEANATSASDTTPQRDRYFYRVRAYNNWGYSPYSSEVEVRVK